MNISNDIERLLASGEQPEQQWVDEVQRDYPYFALPLLMKAKQASKEGYDSDESIMQRLSLMSPDRKALAIAMGKAPAAFANFYPRNEVATPDSDTAIDLFLDRYAGGTDAGEIDAINKAIFNPTPDYADILAAQYDDTHSDSTSKEDQLISSFIDKSRQDELAVIALSPEVKPHVEQADVQQTAGDAIDNSSQEDPSLLSESLAKMYIARKKYSKALEIIESINLNFPKKSIYFADQIRFLRKLVLNETLKNKT